MQPTFESVVERASAVGPSPFELAQVLSGSECDALVERAEQHGFDKTEFDYPPDYRNNDRLVLDDPTLADALFARVRALLPQTVFGARLVGLNPRFRFCRYMSGQKFTVHQDGAYVPGSGRRSLLTLQFSLSSPAGFSGGHTRFYTSRSGKVVRRFRPARGSAIVFRHDDWHDGEPVATGTKIVLRTDVVYEGGDDSSPSPAAGARGYAFSLVSLRDGRWAMGSRDCAVHIFEPESDPDSALSLRAHDASVFCLLEVAPGVLLSGSRDKTLRIHDIDRRTSRLLARREAAVLSLAACEAPGGRTAIGSGLASGAIDVDLLSTDGFADESSSTRVVAHDGWVWALARIGAHGFVSAGADGNLVRWQWRPEGLTRVGSCHLAEPVLALSVSDGPEPRVVAGTASGHIHVLSAPIGGGAPLSPNSRLGAHRGAVTALAPAAGGFVSGGEDGVVHRFDHDGTLRATARYGTFVRAILPLEGDRFAVAGYGGDVFVTGREQSRLGPLAVTCAPISRKISGRGSKNSSFRATRVVGACR